MSVLESVSISCSSRRADVLYVTVYLILMMTVPVTGMNPDPGTITSEDER